MQEKNATGSGRGIEFDALSESTSGINKNRKINEDYKYIDKERNIFVIADGLGGHGNGSEASRITVQTIAYRLTKLYERLKEKDYPPENIQEGIKGVIEYTNSQIIYPIAEFSKDLQNFGTTLVSFFCHNGIAYLHNVGDSHAFSYRNNHQHEANSLFQLTQDDRIQNGHKGCSKEELKIHSINARLKQYIGNEHIQVHSNRVNVHNNDMFLLTTDGILDPVSRLEIAEIISEEEFEDVPGKLVNRANNPILVPLFYSKFKGVSINTAQKILAGKDDITFILLRAREVNKHGT
jgi:protein phosphatase